MVLFKFRVAHAPFWAELERILEVLFAMIHGPVMDCHDCLEASIESASWLLQYHRAIEGVIRLAFSGMNRPETTEPPFGLTLGRPPGTGG
jgi:hypothetical protein